MCNTKLLLYHKSTMNLPIRTMNLPLRALHDIKAFSQPLTRPDWRTCKSLESTLIKELDTKYRKIHEQIMKTAYKNFTQIGRCMMDELDRWTLYGRRKILKEPRGWSARVAIGIPTMDPHPDVYLRRYKFIRSVGCYWREINGEWFPIVN